MTEPGTVTCAASVVWKVPPASTLAGGEGDSDTNTGKPVVLNPGTTHE